MRLLIALIVSLFATLASAAPGDRDPTFGTAGTSRVDLGGGREDGAIGIARLPDDRLVVMGSHGINELRQFMLSRFLPDGALDTTFGNSGSVIAPIPNWFNSTAMALQSNGAILSVGSALTQAGGRPSPMIARHDANGVLDTTFGGTGVIALDFGSTEWYAFAVAVQPDQKILVAGEGYAIVRLNVDGSLDTTFNGTGRVLAPHPGNFRGEFGAIALQSDGKIVAGGTAYSSKYLPVAMRFNPDGGLDSSFGSGGVVVAPYGSDGSENGNAIAIDASGRILLGGGILTSSPTVTTILGAGLARLNPDGSPDTTFGNAGAVSRLDYFNVQGIAIQPTGKIIVALSEQFKVVRYMPDGAVDIQFSSPGLGGLPYSSYSQGMVVQSSGNVVVAGEVTDNLGVDHVLARFDASDSSPAAFQFAGQTKVAPGSTRTSDTITIANLSVPAAISVAGGEYSVGCTGAFTAAMGVIVGGQTVCVRHVASSAFVTTVTTTLTIGLVSGTFSSTTDAITGDADHDGVPNGVEIVEGLDFGVKDNDIFAATTKGARLFAMQQYRDFLGREGDAGGIAAWANYIVGGGGRAAAIEGFFSSSEFQGVISPIARLYFAFFLRVPDYDGLQYWVGRYRNGLPIETIASAFAASGEFSAAYGLLGNAQFVDLVYQNVLGRAPDAGGKAYWLAQLDGGLPRGYMMVGFSESAEYVDASRSEVNVTMTYLAMLVRQPDQSGFTFWVNYLDQGNSIQALINGFLAATEYRQRFLP